MDDPVEAILGACRDLSKEISGLQVFDSAEFHLRISDPTLALWLQPLSRSNINDVPNPPNSFIQKTEFIEKGTPAHLPWMSASREYIEKYFYSGGDFVLSFADYGETKTGTSASTHKRRGDKYAREQREALTEIGIRPEQQIIITLDGRVNEAVAKRLSAYYLATRGWFVSIDSLYIPPGERGTPDIVAWKSPLTDALRETGVIRNGATLEQLVYLRLLDNQISDANPSVSANGETETLVAEVKGSKRSLGEARTQLKKYLKWNSFDSGYCIVPGYRGQMRPGAGTITFDRKGFEIITDDVAHSDSDKKKWFRNQMDDTARQALLSNLPFDDLLSLSSQDYIASPTTPNDWARRVWNLESETIMKAILDELKER